MIMDISIIVTCFNEEDNIRECLHSLIQQDYKDGPFEIIVSDGGSTDDTQSIVKSFIKDYPYISLVVETKKGTAAGRNAGVKASRYDYIAFIDADCEAPQNWLSTLVFSYEALSLKDETIIAVGGTNVSPKNAGPFTQAIGIALDSFPGSFNSVQGRIFGQSVYVSSLSNLNVLYRKEVIEDIGLYDESLLSEAEDADLNYRLSSAGYKLVYIPHSFVWHKMRPTPKTWLKNMFRYGKGRGRLLKRYPKMWSISFILPIIFSIGMLSILAGPIQKIFYLSLFYFPIICLYALYQSYKKKAGKFWLYVFSVYLIQHFGYAAGEVYGLINPKVR